MSKAKSISDVAAESPPAPHPIPHPSIYHVTTLQQSLLLLEFWLPSSHWSPFLATILLEAIVMHRLCDEFGGVHQCFCKQARQRNGRLVGSFGFTRHGVDAGSAWALTMTTRFRHTGLTNTAHLHGMVGIEGVWGIGSYELINCKTRNLPRAASLLFLGFSYLFQSMSVFLIP